jgi:energy-coupling factor transporter ATP-binding protein EcfA2
MLQKLEVCALRGATEKFTLNFEKGKRITILYGENGSGKSTVCDALELLAKGKIGSIEGKGLGKTEPYWHSTGKISTDLNVTLSTTEGQWTGRLIKARAIVTPEAGRPQAEILRRNQIQKIIAEQPKNRFDVIRPFLAIESVEASEGSLRKLIDQEKNNRETAVARIEENRVAVENFWREAGNPKPNALEWARFEIAKDATQLMTELANLERLIREIEGVGSEHVRLNATNEALAKAESSCKSSDDRVSQEQAKVSNKMGDLLSILQAAKDYFDLHDKPKACPLCGSKEFVAGLPQRIDEQLKAIRSLSEALQMQAEAKRNLEFALKQTIQQIATFLKVAEKAAELIKKTGLPSGLTYPQGLLNSVKNFPSTGAGEKDRLTVADALSQKASAFLNFAKPACEKLKEKKGFLQTLKRAVETYHTNYNAQKELDLLIPRLEQALTEIETERRLFVDNILRKIATRVGELYEHIHPGEGVSKISLLLDPDKRASLDILCPFPGAKDCPPGAYFSDSHLDTLGLCIWLAIAELEDARNIILVLDDVVMSVDEPHVERVIELLYEMAQKFRHCIYTTHYRPWREKYRWGWLRSGECQFVELLPWQHKSGIKHTKSLPPIEELRGLLSAAVPSAQLSCASAAVILEAILDFLTQLYECAVPRRKGRPTLGDLLPSIKGKLRAALKIERQERGTDGSETYKEYPLGQLLEELEKIAQVRNVFGCHFNELSHHLPEEDAIHFAKTVSLLADHLIDIDYGWPRSDKSGSYWANSKQTRRLHPLKQPS